MRLFEKPLDERAATYFLDEMADCGGALSGAVRASLLASNVGRLSVPEVVNGDLWNFRTGGKFPSGAVEKNVGRYAVEVLADADDYLATIFSNLAGTSTLAFEAMTLRRDDLSRPWLASRRLAMLDESVLVIADRATATVDEIAGCLNKLSVWYGLAVASEADIGAWPGHREEWTSEDAQGVADGVRCAALSIYDGES